MNGNEFKKARTKMALRSKEIAALLGLRPETIWRWETGRVPVPESAEMVMLQLGEDTEKVESIRRARHMGLEEAKQRRRMEKLHPKMVVEVGPVLDEVSPGYMFAGVNLSSPMDGLLVGIDAAAGEDRTVVMVANTTTGELTEMEEAARELEVELVDERAVPDPAIVRHNVMCRECRKNYFYQHDRVTPMDPEEVWTVIWACPSCNPDWRKLSNIQWDVFPGMKDMLESQPETVPEGLI